MKYELTCINCPMGCSISAEFDGKQVTNIEGYTCKRGLEYAKTEITAPTRMVTALVRIYGSNEPLSVKTSEPVEKAKIKEVLAAVRRAVTARPVHIGDVIIPNVCGTGADIIATEEMY